MSRRAKASSSKLELIKGGRYTTVMANIPFNDLLLYLNPFINNGNIKILDNEDYFINIIENNFSFVGSKINWTQVTGSIVKKGISIDGASKFLNDKLSDGSIYNLESIVIIGDGAMDCAFRTQVQYAILFLDQVVSIPQHTYIVEISGRWCMVFTMEDEIAFGFKPHHPIHLHEK